MNEPPEEPHELAGGARGDAGATAAEEKPGDKSPAWHRRLHHTDTDHGHELARSDGSARHHTSQPLATARDDAEKGMGPEDTYSMRRRLPQPNDGARNPNPNMYKPRAGRRSSSPLQSPERREEEEEAPAPAGGRTRDGGLLPFRLLCRETKEEER